MTTLLANVNLPSLSLGAARAGKFVSVAPLCVNGAELILQPVPSQQPMTVPLEPNSYEPDADKRTILFNVDGATLQAILQLEDRVRELMAPTTPHVYSTWKRAIKTNGDYPATLRAKVHVRGSYEAQAFDAHGAPIPPPAEWKNLCVVPLLRTAVYSQAAATGLILEMVACKITGQAPRQQRVYGFSD
jgi:hypothetical protein